MTMGPVETERKIHQLDNDVQSSYTMLSAIQGTQERHTNRLGELAVKVDGLGPRLGALETNVDGLGPRLGALATKVDTVLDLLRADPGRD